MHRPLLIEVRDELVSVVLDLRYQVGELVWRDAQRRIKFRLETVALVDNARPVVLAPAVNKQLAPLKDADVDKIDMGLTPEEPWASRQKSLEGELERTN